MPFCICEPRSNMLSIEEFLIGKFFSCDIYDSKPIQFLTRLSLTYINHQLVIEDLFLLIRWQGMKILFIKREVSVDILTNRECSLLSIKEFIGSISVYRSIHNIERKSFLHCPDHLISLLLFVDKLSLIGRTDIEFPIIANDSLISIV